MKVSEHVQELLQCNKITAWQAALISGLDEKNQDEFADYLVENKIPSGKPTEDALTSIRLIK